MKEMITIRAFEYRDYSFVRSIYKQGIETGNATFQTQVKEWEEWDNTMLPSCRLVAEKDNTVVGWAALSAVSDRCVYAGVAEVSIYINSRFRGLGIGTSLLEELVFASEKNGIWTLQAGIFPENKASIALHLKNGFRGVGTRERLGKLRNVWRDVVLMERRSTVIGT